MLKTFEKKDKGQKKRKKVRDDRENKREEEGGVTRPREGVKCPFLSKLQVIEAKKPLK